MVTSDQVASAIEEFKPCALSFVQAEVVTGGSNPAKEIFEIAKEFNLITVSDSVSAVGERPCWWMNGPLILQL